MKNNDYKSFKTQLLADTTGTAPIWHAGFLFLQLTDRQVADLKDTFWCKYGDASTGSVKLPNGIILL